MIDDDLRRRLHSVDRDVPLGDAAEQRVLTRMLETYASVEREVTDLTEMPEELRGVSGFSVPPASSDAHPRWAAWATRAAVAALVAGLGVAMVLLRSDDDAAPTTDGSETTSPVESVPAADPPAVPEVIEPLGYRPFTTYQYLYVRSVPGGTESSPMTDRVGGFAANAAGDATDVSLRRSIIGAESGVDERSSVVLAARPGEVIVPLDWLDPPALGGQCVGGAVAMSRESATAIEATATCDGTRRGVVITSVAGPPEQIQLSTGPTVSAQPLSIDIRIEGVSGGRQVTLWFTDRGLVRWDFGSDGPIAQYDLNAAAVAALDDP